MAQGNSLKAGFLDEENGFGVTLLNQAKVIFPLANQPLLLRMDCTLFAFNSSEKCKSKHKTELFYEEWKSKVASQRNPYS